MKDDNICILQKLQDLPEQNNNQNQPVSCSSRTGSMDSCNTNDTVIHTVIHKHNKFFLLIYT